jgi:glucokinase
MAQVTAGVDLGGTKIQVVVVRGRRVLGTARGATPQTGGPDVVAAMAALVEEAQHAAAITNPLPAVGVGSPGDVDGATGAVRSAANVPGFEHGYPLGPELSRALGGVPVRVDNDARASMLGEFRRGAGRPFRDVLGVFVGTGVGGALVLGGRLRRGRGAAGEIGHMVVHPSGRQCPCGRIGCLEAYAGRRSIEETARRRHEKGTKTKLFRIMEKRGRDRATSGVIAQALDEGDEVVSELIDEAVQALGLALASAQNLLDVEAIVVGGGLGTRLGQPFVERIATAMKPHLFVPEPGPSVLLGEVGDLAGAVGASIVAGA